MHPQIINKLSAQNFEFYCDYNLTLSTPTRSQFAFKLFDYQKYITRLIEKKGKVVMVSPRQMGMTSLMQAQSFWKIQAKKDYDVGVVVARSSQIPIFTKRINEWIKNGQTLPGIHPIHTTKNSFYINPNKSTMKIVSSNNVMNFKGSSFDFLVLKDYAYFDQSISNPMSYLLPTLKPNGKIFVYSTPAPNPNFAGTADNFKKLFKDAEKKLNGFYPYRIPWWAKPENTMETFVEIVEGFGVSKYEQELLGQFD